jgi:hypothetical protein
MAAGLEETHQILRENLLDAEAYQTNYATGKHMTFKAGDTVWLVTWNIKTTRPSQKLEYKRAGPYKVSKVINKNTYKLGLPNTICIYNVLHVSFLDKYSPPAIGQPPSGPQLRIVDVYDEWQVK